MEVPTPSPRAVRGGGGESSPSGLQRLVRKSALLNLVIVLTSFPVLVIAGGPNAVVPALEIMAGISLVIWAATFTLFSCASLVRLLWAAFSSGARRKPAAPARRAGVADRWLDGPG